MDNSHRLSHPRQIVTGHASLRPEDSTLLSEQLALHQTVTEAHGFLAIPYYAHLRVRTAGRERDLFLGAATRIEKDVAILDWRAAPLADAFFSGEEGEPFEITPEGRGRDQLIEGTLLARTLLGFENGVLKTIRRKNRRLWLSEGQWLAEDVPRFEFAPRPGARPNATREPVKVILDAEQRTAVERPANRSLLVLGEAGFGKTTVAVHRMAHLRNKARSRFTGAVLVPTEGLRRLTVSHLERMGIDDVEVAIFDQWAGEQAHRAFRGLPKRESEDTPAGSVRLKRHPAVREALRAVAHKVDSSPRRSLWRVFGDRQLLERVLAAANGELGRRTLEETLAHTSIQFAESTERGYDGVDLERLTTSDGRSIDAGTAMNDVETIAVEDYPVLFELDRIRAEIQRRPPARPRLYDCIVLDEAQEFSPLELALVGRSVKAGGTIVVAGDGAQQTDPESHFYGWDRSMAELGARRFETITLQISYRCPPAVTTFARRLLDPATAEPPSGEALLWGQYESECHLFADLARSLRELRESDGAATIAVLCRDESTAMRFGQQLGRTMPVRLVRRGDFDFRAGCNVTTIDESKGLEFDYVVIPDGVVATYPTVKDSRRVLYVAATRASYQLFVAAAGPLPTGDWAPILRAALPEHPAGESPR